MPHRAFQELRARYVALNGVRPTPPGTVGSIEDNLGVGAPDDFIRVCEFYDGTGVVSESVARISADNDGDSIVALTRQFRNELGLPDNYLVLGASEAEVVILDCSVGHANGKPAVQLVRRGDVPQLAVGQLPVDTRSWPTFADYFRELLEREEAS